LFPRSIKNTSDFGYHPIFVTGAPRCGSSWVGEVLSSCANTRYVYEPFNQRWTPSLGGQLAHFTYLNESSMVSPVTRQVSENAFMGLQTWKQLARAAYRGYWHAATRTASRVVIKDPTACLMSAWIAKQFRAQILFIMRHPCGFASSMDRLDWKLGVNGLLRQNDLLQDYLSPFKDALHKVRNDKWQTRGAMWAAIHTVYTKQRAKHSDWLLFRYEDICIDPAGQFNSLTKETGLEMSNGTRKKVQSLSAKGSSDPGSTQRNSKSMPDVWRQRMSPGEIDAVMGIVSEFGLDYY